MKYITNLFLLIFIPFSAMANDNHNTIELSEFTKNSMKRTAIVTTDSNGSMIFDTRNGYRSTTFLRLNKDGTKETLCTTSVTEAKKFMLGKPEDQQSDGE